MENLPPTEVLKNLKKKADKKQQWRKVNHARYTMIVVSVLLLFSAIVVGALTNHIDQLTNIVLFVEVALGGIHIGLSVWAKTKPKPALIVAIAIFMFFLIMSGLGDRRSISEGVWWKIIILGLYIRGLLSVKYIDGRVEDDELLDDF